MPAPLNCPETASWPALLDDTVPPDQRRRYERHLESCPACQDRLDRAERFDDELLRRARRVGDPTAAAADSALARVLERLQEVKCSAPTAPGESPDLDFLHPADRPGVLGTLDGFEVQQVIGRGEMGVVLKAFEPALHRVVAIKVLAPALAGSATARRRFTREAQAAAAVCHDHVVAVHGVLEAEGLPYLVMQYVDGESLQERLDRVGPLPVEEVVRIGVQTASGLAAAHAQGLIHRDVKPANLLLEGGLARVKITDFGLARLADDVSLTQGGIVIGTPEYMAPEQARGEQVDHRADLFSLGSVLYACCTGSPPFRGPSALAVLHLVTDQAPVPVRSLNSEVPASLEALIARLMAKDPAERFQSAAEVTALLERYLARLRQPATAPELPPPPAAGLAGLSGPGSATRGLRRFGQRLWLPALVLLPILGLVGGLLGLGLKGAGQPNRDGAAPAKEPAAPVGRLRGHSGTVRQVRFTPDGRRLVSGSGWPGGDYGVRIWDPAAGQELLRVETPASVEALDLSRDGRFALVGLDNGSVLALDLEAGQVVRSLDGHGGRGVSWVAFAADGRHAFSAAKDATALLWDLAGGAEVRRFRVPGTWAIRGAESPDGRRLLTTDDTGVIQLWDVATGEEVKRIEQGPEWISSLAFAPDGRHALVGTADVTLWDLDSGRKVRLFQEHQAEVHEVAVSPDGRWLLTASFDGTVRLWDFQTGEHLRLLGRHDDMVFSAAFAPDGRLVASGGGARREGQTFQPGTDTDIHLWDLTAVLRDAERHKAWGSGWLAVGGILGLLIAFSLAGVWLFVRQRRRAAKGSAGAPVPARQAESEAPVPSVAFACPGCGEGLRARAGLAGKRVKCPRCGAAVPVPGIRASEPGRPG